jgi:hypothetical protein
MLFKCVFTRRKSHQSRIFDSFQFYPQFVQIDMASFRLSLWIFLQDLVCNGRSVCSKGCVCFEQNMSCTELCPCQALDLCRFIHHRSPKPNYYQIGCLDNAFDLVNRIWRYSGNQINTVPNFSDNNWVSDYDGE